MVGFIGPMVPSVARGGLDHWSPSGDLEGGHLWVECGGGCEWGDLGERRVMS